MPQIINTNISSLNAQRNLNTSQNALATSLQRLSSGLRINSAKDDAAGLGIAERMTTQIRGLNQATRNANDGISLAQTGEGALAEIAQNLQRIRELAVQSANATNSASDRAALDLEVQQRLAEIDRVATQTSFNGQKILDGTFGNATFQVGANVGETISVGLATSMRYTDLGRTADYVNGSTAYSTSTALGQQGTGVDITNALASGDLSITVGSAAAVAIGASSDNSSGAGNAGRTASSAYSKVLAINNASVPNLTATADTTVVFDYTTLVSGAAADTYTLTVNGTNIYNAVASTTITGADMASAINSNSAATGVTATFSSGKLTLNAADGRNITVSQTATDADASSTLIGAGLTTTSAGLNNSTNDAKTAATAASGTAVSNVFGGTIRLTSTEAITLSGNNEAYIGYADGSSMALGASALNSASVTSVANANVAITRVDSALTTVTNLRATFGSIQNRFETVITNLTTTAENLTASRSRIQDADFAQETAAMTRAQILQQAGVAMLAQANTLPNQVLQLLQR
jgi:flagellin